MVYLLKCNHFPRIHFNVHRCKFRCIPVKKHAWLTYPLEFLWCWINCENNPKSTPAQTDPAYSALSRQTAKTLEYSKFEAAGLRILTSKIFSCISIMVHGRHTQWCDSHRQKHQQGGFGTTFKYFRFNRVVGSPIGASSFVYRFAVRLGFRDWRIV